MKRTEKNGQVSRNGLRAGRIGIQGKLLGYLALLVAFIISLIWICQIALLYGFYQSYRTGQVRSAAESILNNIDHDDLEELADRRSAIFARLEALIPGCGTPEKAAALFQESAKSRQALAQAKLLEEQRLQQLTELRAALGPAAEEPPEPERFAGRDRETEAQKLRELEAKLEAASSQADQLKGALGQMGDPMMMQEQGGGAVQPDSGGRDDMDRKGRDAQRQNMTSARRIPLIGAFFFFALGFFTLASSVSE